MARRLITILLVQLIAAQAALGALKGPWVLCLGAGDAFQAAATEHGDEPRCDHGLHQFDPASSVTSHDGCCTDIEVTGVDGVEPRRLGVGCRLVALARSTRVIPTPTASLPDAGARAAAAADGDPGGAQRLASLASTRLII